MMVGAATAAAVVAMNRRRETLDADGNVFMANNIGQSAVRSRAEKTYQCQEFEGPDARGN
jgi:hypothetical protein